MIFDCELNLAWTNSVIKYVWVDSNDCLLTHNFNTTRVGLPKEWEFYLSPTSNYARSDSYDRMNLFQRPLVHTTSTDREFIKDLSEYDFGNRLTPQQLAAISSAVIVNTGRWS